MLWESRPRFHEAIKGYAELPKGSPLAKGTPFTLSSYTERPLAHESRTSRIFVTNVYPSRTVLSRHFLPQWKYLHSRNERVAREISQ